MDTPLSAPSPQPARKPNPFWSPLQKQLIGLLYSHNPFYVISAWLLFYGLRISFDTRSEIFNVHALSLSLGGYALLLAVTAILIVRLGKVWDDARSLVLLIVLMFVGLSVTFDDSLAANPDQGWRGYVAGFAFAVALSEVLIRGLRLRLPMHFRIPFYLSLALTFLYPIWVGQYVRTPQAAALQWTSFGFSLVLSLLVLTLLPAVYADRAAAGAQSPWRWPWYPWVLFGMLALAIPMRGYYLCVSLHFVRGSYNIFGPYFLAPFVLAVGVLLMETGRAWRNDRLAALGWIAPLVAVLLSGVGHRTDPVYSLFLGRFLGAVHATPLFVVIVLAAAIYAIARLRRIRLAGEALVAMLVGLTTVGPGTLTWSDVHAPGALPVAAAGAWVFITGLRRGATFRLLLGSFALSWAAILASEGTVLALYAGLLSWHLLLASLLAVGVLGRDRLAKLVQDAAAALLFATFLVMAAAPSQVVPYMPDRLLYNYYVLVIAGGAAYGYFARNRLFYATAAIEIALSTTILLGRGYGQLRHHLPGLAHLTWAAMFFLVALAISLFKAGAIARLRERWARVAPNEPSG